MRKLLLVLLVLVAPAARAQPVAGVVGVLSGSATVSTAGSAAAPLQQGAGLHDGAVVHTGPSTRMRIDLADGSTLSLGAATSLRIDHLAPAGTTEATRLTHLLGYLRTVVAPQGTRGSFEIDTNSVVAAVRGTDWIQNTRPSHTEVYVESGHVLLRGAGGPVMLSAGQGDTYWSRARHSRVVHWAQTKIAAFEMATQQP